MKVYAINGSPRKNWNTAMLLEHSLAGAAAQGAETELIHLYDLNFKGCTSCFADTQPPSTVFDRKVPTAFIYTMNISEKMMQEYQYPVLFGMNENYLARIFGQCETFCCNETLQFEDYDKVVFNYFDPEERRKRRINVFPDDCRKASELGGRLVNAVWQAATLPL